MESFSNLQLTFLRDLLMNMYKLYSFTISEDFVLTDTNCPEKAFFFELLRTSDSLQELAKYFAGNALPTLFIDCWGFGWVAAKMDSYYLLGPYFPADAAENNIRQAFAKKKLSEPIQKAMEAELTFVSRILM